MPPIKRRPGSANKNPPFFSHEFVIQNHGDIAALLAMVFILGLLFQVTQPYASMFIVMSHNVTDTLDSLPTHYTFGVKDVAMTFFYFLISIVMHAVIQEYFLDKINRKLHLSKTKHSKFNESGQLLIFELISAVYGAEIINREDLVFNISLLWNDYPNHHMSYLFKFYFIIQIAYWLHAYPELYFQKVKKDDIPSRLVYSTLYLASFLAAYLFNFTRIAVCLATIHYMVDSLFHFSRLIHFSDRQLISAYCFKAWNVFFTLARLASINLSVLTFWYGLDPTSNKDLNPNERFNRHVLRLSCLAGLSFLQIWMMWNFINFHLSRLRQRAEELQRQKEKQKLLLKGKKEDEESSEVKTEAKKQK